jgi:hypothetical protein
MQVIELNREEMNNSSLPVVTVPKTVPNSERTENVRTSYCHD